jgi:hypothetical protein
MLRFLTASFLVAMLVLFGCGGDDAETAADGQASTSAGADDPVPATLTGKVIETMDSGGYTYVKVESEDGAFWAACSPTEVAVGDEVTVSTGMPMENFHSESLDRTFELIFFTGSLDAGGMSGGMGGMGSMGEMPGGHGRPDPVDTEVDLSDIAKAAGGHTVAEIHAAGDELAGTAVSVRGRVVKYTGQIMGRNWIHLRDGSGDATAGTHDLTITTQSFARVGDLVLVEGQLAANKDFGAGYKYDVIIENASVKKE